MCFSNYFLSWVLSIPDSLQPQDWKLVCLTFKWFIAWIVPFALFIFIVFCYINYANYCIIHNRGALALIMLVTSEAKIESQ